MNNDKAKAEILDKCSQSVECLARGKVLDLVGTLDAAQTSPETETLKPCPFCGCDKIVIFYDHPNSVGEFLAGYYVSHPVWKEHPDTWGCHLSFGGKFETEKEAADAWNSRFDHAPTAQQWQSIETAPDNERLDFYLDWADDCARLNPAMGPNDPFRFHRGFKKTWGSIYKATHWRPMPEPPAGPDTSTGGNSQANTTGGTFGMKPAALTITPPIRDSK